MGAADDEAELRTTIDIEAHGSGERGYTGIEGTQASGCWGGDAEANAIANGSSSASSPKVRRSHQFANRESACILVVLAVMFSLLFVYGMYHIHGAALATGGAGGGVGTEGGILSGRSTSFFQWTIFDGTPFDQGSPLHHASETLEQSNAQRAVARKAHQEMMTWVWVLFGVTCLIIIPCVAYFCCYRTKMKAKRPPQNLAHDSGRRSLLPSRATFV